MLKKLQAIASDLTQKWQTVAQFNPEDQLKSSVEKIIKEICQTMLGNSQINVVTEVQERSIAGRPDMGVSQAGLIIGHIELKAPDKKADPRKFAAKSADAKQWQKFQQLPNLIYTNGNDWLLFRSGVLVENRRVSFIGDVTSDGARAINKANVDNLIELIRDFMLWQPTVPRNPKELAQLLAPLCLLLRSDVLEALPDPESPLSILFKNWQTYLFADASDFEFADAYAQTMVYALLLARQNGLASITIDQAVSNLRTGHRLLSDTLKLLGDLDAREVIATSIDVIERIIQAVDSSIFASGGDPWLYFYEEFLAAYDNNLRKQRGVYYTPIEIIQAQVGLVNQLLTQYFKAPYGMVDPKVVTLDPATGTGTYLLTALQESLNLVDRDRGKGLRTQYASFAAQNMHAFELLVGPYAVAHLRFSQAIAAEKAQLPADGVHVYLSDTLDSPNNAPPQQLTLVLKSLSQEQKRVAKVKQSTEVLVCIGNPPYNRQIIDEEQQDKVERKGGWVRFGSKHEPPIFNSFTQPVIDAGKGGHLKNIYNDYVYFWRWAMWKVFEQPQSQQGGVISFITASSYLRGPGFAGMRQHMRQIFDELWLIDLGGDNIGARKTENVFAIETPVVIAVGVRYTSPKPTQPATVHYCCIEGTTEEKLAQIAKVKQFSDLVWEACGTGWFDPFIPAASGAYATWPKITDLFPWQISGMQYKRTWPIAANQSTIQRRWEYFIKAENKAELFSETRDRKVDKLYGTLTDKTTRLPALRRLTDPKIPITIEQIGYRSFDRQWAIVDNRVGDFLRPDLHTANSEHQIYFTSLLTDVLGSGSAAVISHLIPDMHYFRNRGGKDVIPLWRDAAASQANVPAGLLDHLASELGFELNALDLMAYCYTLLASPTYTARFESELRTPGPRIPITSDGELFRTAVSLGKRLIWLHSYGQRCVPSDQPKGIVPRGQVRCDAGTSQSEYPNVYHYDEQQQQLTIGTSGVFSHVRPEVFNFSVSGLKVVQSWLGYRMAEPAGRSSSPLDKILPERWEFDDELLELLWLLDHTIDLQPQLAELLEHVLNSPLLLADDLPEPSDLERAAPKPIKQTQTKMPLQ